MEALDVENGRRNKQSPVIQKPSAWIEDEVQELALSSSASGSSNEDSKREETSFSQPSGRSPITPKNSLQIISSVRNSPVNLKLLSPRYQKNSIESEALSIFHQRVKDSEFINDAVSSSSRRQSIDDSSLDGNRSVTSQSLSETRSYRDKLRDRFQSVKARVGHTSTGRKKPLTKHATAPSRADELLKKEEQEVTVALEKHNQARNRWKNALQSSKEQLPDKNGSFDFFTKMWESENIVPSPAPARPANLEVSPVLSGVGAEHEAEGLVGESAKLLATDYLGLSQEDWKVVDHCAKPDLPHLEEVAEKISKLYFYPSTSSVPLEDRLKPGKEVRYPEEEGLYIGRRPKTKDRNYNRLKNRIINHGNLNWFGDDGEILTLPNPLRLNPYRPPQIEEQLPLYLQSFYLTGMVSSLPVTDVAIEGENHALLELEVGSLRFQHHPLFSKEHVLAQRLCNLYSQYKYRSSLRHEERLKGRLDLLRQVLSNLENDLNSESSSPSPHQLERMQRYKEEIREAWNHLLTEGLRDRQLLASLLTCWKTLKRLREEQGYSSTPQRIAIQKERLSPEQLVLERNRWEAEIRLASSEKEEQLRNQYSIQWDEYQQQLRSWESKKKRILQGSKKVQSSDIIEENTDEQSILAEADADDLDGEPLPPNPIDPAEIGEQVLTRMRECLRPPGEPKVNITLIDSGRIDADPGDPLEKQRRGGVKRCHLFVKIFYNEKEVCRTQSQSLNSRFKISFNECFSIRILQPPESIKLEIFEDGAGSGLHSVSQIYLPIPSGLTTLNSAPLEDHEFSSDRVVTFNHSAVGSGTFVHISSDKKDGSCLYTSGCLGCRAGWGINPENDSILAPKEKYLPSMSRDLHGSDFLARLGSEASLDVEKLTEWAIKSKLDPNDPGNSSFFHFIKNAGSRSRDTNFFRLEPLQAEFDFCDFNSIDSNPRLKLLRLRAQGETEFREWKFVPNREKEIPKDVFKTYEKRISACARETDLELDLTWPDPLSSHRAWGHLYLERVYQRVLAQCRQAQRTAAVNHIVSEEQVPDINTLGLTFMKWLQPKRPLRPMRKERKKVAVQSLAGQEVKLIVSVIRAFEVPVRKNTDSLAGNVQSTTNLGFTCVPVRPFFEVSFQGTTLRTTTAEGANPTWNQDLQILVRPGNSEAETLYIHLFDEVLVDLVEDDRLRETSIHQRLERHWLASLQIPFMTLVYNCRIEGTFKMYSPPMLLGYERETETRSGWQGNSSLDPGNFYFPHRNATFVNLFITVQPALNPPESFKERLDSSEVAALEQHLLHFENEVERSVPHRRIKTLVIDVSGKTVCITRFFRPLAPPVILEGQDTTEQMAARFVSMIPAATNYGLFDIWLTCDQILRLGWGNAWAHAVLLCCYLMGLGHKAWLLAGMGIPHGPAAYVLVKEKRETKDTPFWIWDPVSGQRYSIFDSFCPLQQVHGLINDENIWVNLQREELPRRTQFDVSRRSDWLPAMGRFGLSSGFTAPTGSVQPTFLQYTLTNPSSTATLQDKLEKRLKDAIMKWRRTQRTQWNRYCIATLRKMLPRLEQACWTQGDDHSSPLHSKELHHILGSHKMCGFPINLPYTTTESVLEAVRATGVHKNQDEGTEFALAVYVHAFPNNVLSLWIYVASLTKLR